MKKLLLVVVIGIFGLTVLSAQEIEVVDAIDFGQIAKDSEAVKTIIIKNVGDKPLVISETKASCGCTVPQLPSKDPILPGKTTEMKVQYKNTHIPGAFNKTVTIYSNSENNARKLVRVKGVISK